MQFDTKKTAFRKRDKYSLYSHEIRDLEFETIDNIELLIQTVVRFGGGGSALSLLIYNAVKNSNWKGFEESFEIVVNLSVTIVLGCFTVVGIIASINKSHYIGLGIKAVFKKMKILDRIEAIMIYMAFIIPVHFVCLLIKSNVSYPLYCAVGSLQLLGFIMVFINCGIIFWKSFQMLFSDPTFEYAALDGIYREFWSCSKESIKMQEISEEGAIKDFKYLLVQMRNNMKKADKITEIKYSSVLIEKENKLLSWLCSIYNNLFILLMGIGVGYIVNLFIKRYGDFLESLKYILVIGIVSTIVGRYKMNDIHMTFCFRWECLFFKAKKVPIFLGVCEDKKIICLINTYSKAIISIQNVLAFYRYVLLSERVTEESAGVADKLLEICQDNYDEVPEKYEKDSSVIYPLIIQMMYYFQYEYFENGNCLEDMRSNFHYEKLHQKQKQKIDQWMTALISSINPQTKETDKKALKNPIFENFKSERNNLYKNCKTK